MTSSKHREDSGSIKKIHEPELASSQPVSEGRLIGYLPAIYQDGNMPGHPSFLARYLDAFETLLIGSPELRKQASTVEHSERISLGLEEKIDRLPQLFSATEAPAEFLPWLASWAALSFHPYLAEERRRALLANIIPLYRIRGTSKYMARLLEICVNASSAIDDRQPAAFQIQRHSTIGKDAYIGGGPAHYFTVALDIPAIGVEDEEIQIHIARSVIELAKPAHTVYTLSVSSPRMQASLKSMRDPSAPVRPPKP